MKVVEYNFYKCYMQHVQYLNIKISLDFNSKSKMLLKEHYVQYTTG